ncbi:MAG: isochorismatase family protein [Lachnospiraceae bacterium]|nr:isochorismatase family protein [Lachnospiraceae bacterium]
MYTIKEISSLANVSTKTLRYYDDIGILHPEERTESGYRLYSDESLSILLQINLYKDYGFSLLQIQELLHADEKTKERIIAEHIEHLQEEIRRFSNISRILKDSLPAASGQKLSAPSQNSEDRCCLLIMNVQNDFLIGGPYEGIYDDLMLTSLQKLIACCRLKKIPIIYICDIHLEDTYYRFDGGVCHCIPGTKGIEIPASIKPADHDNVIYKSYYSSFKQSDLFSILTSMKIRHLYLTGTESDLNIYPTVLDAYELGFSSTIITDAVSALTEEAYYQGLDSAKSSNATDLIDTKTFLEKFQ